MGERKLEYLIALEVGWKWMEINDGFTPGIRNNEESNYSWKIV